jgi:hypothetical protein
MYDPYTRHPLHFQYHYAAFVLGRSCVADGGGDALRDRVFDYLCALPDRERRITDEFNAFLLSLAHWTVRGVEPIFAARIADYLGQLRLPTAEALLWRNRNFAFMLRFALEYARAGGATRGTALLNRIGPELERSCRSDGFLIDTPLPAGGGFLSMVYHAKIAAVLVLDGVLLGNDARLTLGRRAIDVMLSVSDPGVALAQGRSPSSVFGFANLYLAARLLAGRFGDARYGQCAQAIHARLSEQLLPDGEMALNPARDNGNRHGFDYYYHVIVYNAYAWAMVLTANRIAPECPADSAQSPPSRPAVRPQYALFNDTGVISARCPGFDTYFTTRRHQTCSKLWHDPRYACLVPIVVMRGRRLVVPPPAVDYGGHVHFAVQRGMRERLRFALSSLRFVRAGMRYHNFLDRGGFFPYFRVGHWKICAGTQTRLDVQLSADGDMLVIEAGFRWDAIRRRDTLMDRLVRHIRPAEWGFGSAGLAVRMTISARALTYEFDVHDLQSGDDVAGRRKATDPTDSADRAPAPIVEWVHLNIRALADDACSIGEDGRTLRFAGGWRVRHSRPAAPLEILDVPGAHGVVRYYRSTTPVRRPLCDNIRTELVFGD